MKYILLTIGLVTFINISCAQVNDSIPKTLELPEFFTDKNFKSKYNNELARLRRVYPMALHAKKLIDDYESDLQDIDKKRKQKKYGKDAHKELKEDFNFVIRDLYVSEGILLMQLIHRETGMTVREIIKKYRGNMQASMYDGMGKLFDQDIDAKYDAKGKNWITEIVLYDINHGNIPFDFELKTLTKEDYKESKKEYKDRAKDTKQRLKTMRKIVRENEKAQKKRTRKGASKK